MLAGVIAAHAVKCGYRRIHHVERVDGLSKPRCSNFA
jgi:hypothetical protein